MSWFKRLFRGKSEKPTEEKRSNTLENLNNVTIYVPAHKACTSTSTSTRAVEVSQPNEPVNVPVPGAIFMLTTMNNFRSDPLEQFSYESEWIIVDSVEISEPKFRECLKKTEKLSQLCRTRAETSLNKRTSRVTAKSPVCICNELRSSGNEKPLRLSVCRRIAYSVKKMCSKLKFWKKNKAKGALLYQQWMNSVEENNYYIPAATYLAEGCMPSHGAKTDERVGANIRAYVLHLAQDKTTIIAKTIAHFIACMQNETCSQVMMRNIRRFMTGMKNYLVTEKEFQKEIQKERQKLKPSQVLYLDAILEGVMHKLVIQPLQPRLYALLCTLHTDDIRTLHTAIEKAQNCTALQLGIKESRMVPSASVLAVISRNFQEMQNAYSPLDKLQKLLASISIMFKAIRGEKSITADDLLPVLAWCLARCRVVRVEIEAALLSGLLPETLASAGEGSYYIMSLFSAIDVLKQLAMAPETPPKFIPPRRRCSLSQCSSSRSRDAVATIRVVLKDECRGCFRRVPVPCQIGANAYDLCHALCHAIDVTNPREYALFALYDGQERMLNPDESPQDLLAEKSGKNFALAFKRIDEPIDWPKETYFSNSD